MVEIMFKEFNSHPFLSLTDVVLKVFVMMQVGFKSNWTYSHQGFRRMMAFSFAECRRGVGASILQLLWLTLKGYNHCKQTKVEDIREFSPGSSPLCMYVHAKSLSRVRLFVTLWTVAHQAPLSLGFSRQGYWSGLPCLLQGIFLM